MSAKQQVITIDHISVENAPAVYVQNGLKPFLQMIKDEVCGEVPDLSTRKGRDRIASLAATVGKRKVAVEKPGREYLRSIKELPKIIEAELREFVREADALRDEIRKPLTDWEAAETARKDRHVDAIQAMKDAVEVTGPLDAAQIQAAIDEMEARVIDDSWEEFLAEAAQVKDQCLLALRNHLKARQVYEAEQAELARHRAEAEARAKADHEAAIAREAAERAQREADERAAAERAAAAKREQDLLDQAAAQQRAAEQAAREAEAAAERRAEQERAAASQRAEQAAEQARLDEQRRQKEAADEILRQTAAREADKAHKLKINRAALDAFVAGGMTEECAKLAITLIVQRRIPAIAITY
jgi:hypothetical protein